MIETIYCDTCDREFGIGIERDTGQVIFDDNAPTQEQIKCGECPYNHHMCAFCQKGQPTCPEPWECMECGRAVTSLEHGDYCSGVCEAAERVAC